MVYGMAIIAGTAMGMVGLASLAGGEGERAAPPKPADVSMLVSPSIESEKADRTLVRRGGSRASDAFADPGRAAPSRLALPVGSQVIVQLRPFGQQETGGAVQGVLVAVDEHWLQVRDDDGADQFIPRDSVNRLALRPAQPAARPQ